MAEKTELAPESPAFQGIGWPESGVKCGSAFRTAGQLMRPSPQRRRARFKRRGQKKKPTRGVLVGFPGLLEPNSSCDEYKRAYMRCKSRFYQGIPLARNRCCVFLAFLPLKSFSGYFSQRLANPLPAHCRLSLPATGAPPLAHPAAASYLNT
ncbi:protein of unknown function (plasmid) [Cupriavidus taiwanensis]|uniref:Uncharacterized protein n=1 Tax=Cupriavidus taiwanensis TaxID=164546 RepID=A0A375IPP9_9BURK|nr:protein of unknown function [Cupriavidus taiwanensis]